MTKPAQADSRAGFVVSEGFGRPSGAADLLQKGRGGAFVLELNRDGPGAPGGDELRLGEVLDAVVAALDVDVGVGKLDGLERHLVLEDDHEGDGLERGEYGGAVGLGVDRTVVALAEHLDGGVAVDGHDETAAEAEAETQQQLNCYADVCEQDLAIPVVKGRKTDKEKFAGAEATYTIEAMMKDGKALQSGTSHYFGDKFSKAYDVTFTGRDNQLHHPFQTSWGVSTRLVGAIIMTHGDDDGLILPPAVAPIQVVVVPIAAHKPGVSEKAAELAEKISKYARVKLDDSDNAPGWKFSQWEMKGVPLRLEIGPKDLEKNQCVLVRRDTREKIFVSLDELETAIPAQLEALRKDLYERALANREKRTWAATTMEEVKELAKANTGYIKTMWCGDLACEMKMKEEVGLSSRCMPFEQEHLSDVCPCCGKPAKTMVYWGIAY